MSSSTQRQRLCPDCWLGRSRTLYRRPWRLSEKDMKAMEKRLDKRIDTTNEDMQVQLAQHRKDVRNDVKALLAL